MKNDKGPSNSWQPRRERRLWPWVLLAVIVVGVCINIALTV